MLDTLQKQPVVGTIRTPDSLAYDLHYARVQPWDDGGQQIVIEMRVNHDGKGEGKMSVATRVIAAGNQIILEDYSSQAVMLTDVTREK